MTHLLDRLAAQGVRAVVLCVGHLGQQVEEALGGSYRGMRLSYSREDRPLGTCGALVAALPMLSSDTLLVLNGDSICAVDLQTSLQWHLARRARATLVLAHVEDTGRFGQVEVAADGRIVRFSEKSGAAGGGWINGGVYWLDRSALVQLPRREPLSLEREVFPGWVGQGLYGYLQHGRFLDIGVPQDYLRAESFLNETPEAVVATAV